MNKPGFSYFEFISFFKERNINCSFDPNIFWHRHHIIPKHAGGTDDESNILKLTISEHSLAHFLRYLEFGETPDLTSSKMLSGQSKSISSYAGKLSAIVCREKKVNAFFDPLLRKEIAIKGGHAAGIKNRDSGHLKRISTLGSKMRGKIWLTNGIENKVINKTDTIPDGYYRGKIQK